MEEKIYFENSKRNKLCGILSQQADDKAVIVLCHGFSTSKDSSTCIRLQNILNNAKISTFRFDFFGHGESEGKFEDITITEAVDDILSAIKFLKEKWHTKIGLFGSSFGGLAALLSATKTSDLFVLILKSPVSNYEELYLEKKKELDEWKRNGFTFYVSKEGEKRKLNYSFFKDFKSNDGYVAAKKIKIPTLIVHGDEDETVPVKQSRKTAGLMANCTLKIIHGANHRYSREEDFQKMLNLTASFIKTHL